ncbi:metal-dependent hydrolase [Rhodococcus erythropolis]|uniref:metal-dependent hydrolase n=1 Tax=Rhodococcus erythropolis TaxID=1833 RepID=UPI001E2C1B6A|nr:MULTISPECIES: metal-dependent hydrolase [Rhodococcus erythropolis group]MCD2105338.1 metal-dependent hydrolase [Rhodococcus qingshengii]MCZ4524058.1 metal-dependent hydrolase [Rhodococcus erythropolis]
MKPVEQTPAELGRAKALLAPRNVGFDWSTLPVHWVPGDPVTTHVLNVLHLFLPAVEYWFVETYKETYPLITDENLRADVIGFIGQESVHADAHSGVLENLTANGIDPTAFVSQMDWIFSKILGPYRDDGATNINQLVERLALIAAFEHITAFMGEWVLNASGLDAAGADPRMLDLLRWHGAEEVEHRAVAYDVLCYFDRRYSRRIRALLYMGPVTLFVFAQGTIFLLKSDPTLKKGTVSLSSALWSGFTTAVRRGTLPSPISLLTRVAAYLDPGYHPTNHGSTEQAVTYLATSPAVRAMQK